MAELMSSRSGRRANIFLRTEEDILEEQQGPGSGEGPKDIEFPISTQADRKLAAELVGYLEAELETDMRRLHVRVIHSRVYIQGTVPNREIRTRIEDLLRRRADVRDVELAVSLAESTDD